MYRRTSRSSSRRTRASAPGSTARAIASASRVRVSGSCSTASRTARDDPLGARRARHGRCRTAPSSGGRAPAAFSSSTRDPCAVARKDVERHDGQTRRVAGACLEGPVPADLHGHLGQRERREPCRSLRQQGQGGREALDVERVGRGPRVAPPTGRFPARAAGREPPCRPAGWPRPGSDRRSARRDRRRPRRRRWPPPRRDGGHRRGRRAGFAAIGSGWRAGPSASAAGRSMATMRTSGGGGREPAQPEEEVEPDRFLQRHAERQGMNRRPATAVSVPMPRGRPSTRPRRMPRRRRDLAVSRTPPDGVVEPGVVSRRLTWAGSIRQW